MVWHNDDGLTVKFGLEEAVPRNIGAYNLLGPLHWVEILVDWSELPVVADGSVILNDSFKIPSGVIIEETEIRTPTEAFVSGGGGTFNLGIIDADRTSNADVDFLVQEATVAELNTGGRYRMGLADPGWGGGGAYAQPRVPLTGTTGKLLTWEVNTGAFTAGTTVIRVWWSKDPVNTGDTLVWAK